MEVEQSDSMEVDQSVGVLPKDIYPVPAPMQGSELTGGEEAVAEVTVYCATKQDKLPGAG